MGLAELLVVSKVIEVILLVVLCVYLLATGQLQAQADRSLDVDLTQRY
jgi:hypothetical protein